MAGRAANDFFGFFVNIKIINIQVVNIFIDEATALNRANEFDTTIGSSLNIFIAAIVCVSKHLSRQKLGFFQAIEYFACSCRVRLNSSLRQRTGDKLHLIVRMTGFADLHLIARPLMAVVGGVQIRWILYNISAGLLLDADFLFMDFALFIKNTFHSFISVTTSVLGSVGKTTNQKIHIFCYLLAKQTA
ncbi:hypothetical protein ES703_82076 [subsurface metagenome]